MSEGVRRGESGSRLEVWGMALAVVALVAFGAAFGIALSPRASVSESADEGPGDPRQAYRAEQGVEAWHAGRWYPARVHSASAHRYFITYDDFSTSWHEWVTARRLRPR